MFGSININNSLYGIINRHEGLYVILAYFLLSLVTLNITNKTYKKIIIGSIILIGLMNIIYGLLQTDIIKTALTVKNKWYYARGFNLNSMYYASLLSICFPIVLGLFIKSKKLYENIMLFILLLIFSYGMIISGSMAVYISSILIFVFIIIKEIIEFIKNKDNKKELIKISISIVILLSSSMLFKQTNPFFKKDTKELYKEASSAANLKILGEYESDDGCYYYSNSNYSYCNYGNNGTEHIILDSSSYYAYVEIGNWYNQRCYIDEKGYSGCL